MGDRYKMVLGYSPTFKRNKCKKKKRVSCQSVCPLPLYIFFFLYYFNKPSNIKVKVMV